MLGFRSVCGAVFVGAVLCSCSAIVWPDPTRLFTSDGGIPIVDATLDAAPFDTARNDSREIDVAAFDAPQIDSARVDAPQPPVDVGRDVPRDTSRDASPPAPGLRTDFGGELGFGTSRFCGVDDLSQSVPVTSAFPSGILVRGVVQTSLTLAANGVLQFANTTFSQYTPAQLPFSNALTLMPFWADVDLRYSSSPLSSCTTNGMLRTDTCLPSNTIYVGSTPGRFAVTWNQVAFYNSCGADITTSDRNKQNTFQVILERLDAIGYAVEYRYARCDWETGDASGGMHGVGGTPAQMGYDFGDRTTYYQHPQSRMNGIATTLCTTSNVGTPGVWRFEFPDGF